MITLKYSKQERIEINIQQIRLDFNIFPIKGPIIGNALISTNILVVS